MKCKRSFRNPAENGHEATMLYDDLATFVLIVYCSTEKSFPFERVEMPFAVNKEC
jgi:hypothetical protein